MYRKLMVAGAGLVIAVVANLAFPDTLWVSAGEVVGSVEEPAPLSLMIAGLVGLILVRKRIKNA